MGIVRMLALGLSAATLTAYTPAATSQDPGSEQNELSVTMVGNAGVILTDGATSLLVDLPYESGAHGYMTYEPAALHPPGAVTSIITHHHTDHFDPALFLERDAWRILGPPSVTRGLPSTRVVEGDSVRLSGFEVVVVPTPHTPDHRSYRIRWGGHVLHFTGDTEDPARLHDGPAVDILFVTPWLSCAAGLDAESVARRRIAYHLNPRGTDRVCGEVEILPQGASFLIEAAPRTPAP